MSITNRASSKSAHVHSPSRPEALCSPRHCIGMNCQGLRIPAFLVTPFARQPGSRNRSRKIALGSLSLILNGGEELRGCPSGQNVNSSLEKRHLFIPNFIGCSNKCIQPYYISRRIVINWCDRFNQFEIGKRQIICRD